MKGQLLEQENEVLGKKEEHFNLEHVYYSYKGEVHILSCPQAPQFFQHDIQTCNIKRLGIGLEMSTNLYKMYKIISLKSEYIHVHVSTALKHA